MVQQNVFFFCIIDRNYGGEISSKASDLFYKNYLPLLWQMIRRNKEDLLKPVHSSTIERNIDSGRIKNASNLDAERDTISTFPFKTVFIVILFYFCY